MMTIALLLFGTLAAHQATVEHRGARYDVAHRAHVETRTKTVGAAVGGRAGMQRCRWTATVRVQREIARPGGGEGVATLLPASQTVQGDLPGACMGRPVSDARVRDAATRLVDAAHADRAATLAAIDAAHALAAN